MSAKGHKAKDPYACKTQKKTDHRKAVLKLVVDMLNDARTCIFGAARLPDILALDCDTYKFAGVKCRSSGRLPQHCAANLFRMKSQGLAEAPSTSRRRLLHLLKSVGKMLLGLCHPVQMVLCLLSLLTQR